MSYRISHEDPGPAPDILDYLNDNWNGHEKQEKVSKYCKGCGAPVTIKCEYCGTFRVNPENLHSLTINEKRKLLELPEI